MALVRAIKHIIINSYWIIGLPYDFLDVLATEEHAVALRKLYKNKKLDFTTITIST